MRERDPLLWAFSLPWRPLGVTVKVHVLFPCLILGVILWVATSKQFGPGLWKNACVALVILFVSVLLHERLTVGWRGRRASWLAIMGFVVLVITFVGANLWMSGYHSFSKFVQP